MRKTALLLLSVSLAGCATASTERRFIATDKAPAALAVYFRPPAPARAVVGVAGLPRGARVEIVMTAARQRSSAS